MPATSGTTGNKNVRDRVIRDAMRDGYHLEFEYKGFFLILTIDEDKEESLKKNFYEIIGPNGEKYLYQGCTYRRIGHREFVFAVEEIQDGTRKPYQYANEILSEKYDDINGDICAMRSAISNLWDNRKYLSCEQKSEIQQVFIKLKELGEPS